MAGAPDADESLAVPSLRLATTPVVQPEPKAFTKGTVRVAGFRFRGLDVIGVSKGFIQSYQGY